MAEFFDETRKAIIAQTAFSTRQVPMISREVGELQAIFEHEMELSDRLEQPEMPGGTFQNILPVAVQFPRHDESAW